MATLHHQRSESSESSSSGSSAYQLILDHILSCPGTYEIPLRTMYTLNSAPRAQPTHSGRHSPSSSSGSSPITGQGPFQDAHATKAFSDNLTAQLTRLPDQPTSLPPSFCTSFVAKCFVPDLPMVDFPQALTSIDYLKDLETRRRREVAAAMNRLAITRDTLGAVDASIATQYPGVAQWVQSIETQERKIDALYTQLYVGLRRWILINELWLTPFNKHNCFAMLNTLYPPVVSAPPTSRLTPAILKNQRDGFIKYIQGVEKNGPRILETLMQQGKAAGEENGWVAVTRILGKYLQLANSMIKDCAEITDPTCVSPRGKPAKGDRQPRKVDSGVSFNVSEPITAPSSRSNSLADAAPPLEPERPATARYPSSTTKLDTIRPSSPTGSTKTVFTTRSRALSSAKPGTTLERLARGLKTWGRVRTDATEMISEQYPPLPPLPDKQSRSLRKMRSMGTMEAHSGLGKSDAALPKNGQRMLFDDAGVVTGKLGSKRSHEV